MEAATEDNPKVPRREMPPFTVTKVRIADGTWTGSTTPVKRLIHIKVHKDRADVQGLPALVRAKVTNARWHACWLVEGRELTHIPPCGEMTFAESYGKVPFDILFHAFTKAKPLGTFKARALFGTTRCGRARSYHSVYNHMQDARERYRIRGRILEVLAALFFRLDTPGNTPESKIQCFASVRTRTVSTGVATLEQLRIELSKAVQGDESGAVQILSICGSKRSPECNVPLIEQLVIEFAAMLAAQPLHILHGPQGVGIDIVDTVHNVFGRRDLTDDTLYVEREKIIAPADAVLILGGADMTLVEAELAIRLRKVIIPVPATGGSAKVCYGQLRQQPDLVRKGMELVHFQRLARLRNPTAIRGLVESVLYGQASEV